LLSSSRKHQFARELSTSISNNLAMDASALERGLLSLVAVTFKFMAFFGTLPEALVEQHGASAAVELPRHWRLMSGSGV
jgi:hypothetical protein